jgi:transcriptional regulator with XRE-family HTH domain
MANLTERLQAAREGAGLTIEDIAERTRIKPALLHALERGDVSRLPGPFYTKTFIRAYAREVGLEPDELLAEFAATTAALPQPAVRVADIPPVRRIARYETPRTSTWQFVPIAAIVAAVIFLGGRQETDAGRQPEPGAVGTAGVARAALTPVAAASERTAPGMADALTLDITPSAPVWVAASADGTVVVYRLLNVGERAVVEARDEIAVRIGDAAAFAYTINGSEGVTLGAPGEVRDIRITRENVATFRR